MTDSGKRKRGGHETEEAPRATAPVPPPFKPRYRGPALTKAELRAQGQQAMAAASKTVVKLPTKLVRQCGRCGEFTTVMVEPGDATPAFKCKSCDRPDR